MPKKPNPYLTDADNPPLTAEMLSRARPAREVFAELGINYPGLRGPQKASTKVQTTIRLDRDLVDTLRREGAGWQTRANDILRRAVLPATVSRTVKRSPAKAATTRKPTRKRA